MQCHRELVVQCCSYILQKWRDHRLEFPALSDLPRNPFCIIATNTDSERVFGKAGHFVNSRRAHIKCSSVRDIHFFKSA